MNELLKAARAVAYTRSAVDGPGNGIMEQEAFIMRVAEKYGANVVKTYSDVGVSGTHFHHRKGMETMLAEIGPLGIEIILICDLSRLSRRMEGLSTLLGIIEDKGTRVYCCQNKCFLGKNFANGKHIPAILPTISSELPPRGNFN